MTRKREKKLERMIEIIDERGPQNIKDLCQWLNINRRKLENLIGESEPPKRLVQTGEQVRLVYGYRRY